MALTFGLLSPEQGHRAHAPGRAGDPRGSSPTSSTSSWGRPTRTWCASRAKRYRLSLERLAEDLGIEQHVIFYNRFVELNELTEFIRAADVYVTPYLNPAQITSGTLAYSFGCGKAIVSTPYWHAEELLADGRGVLVPFADPQALAREIVRAAARRAAAAMRCARRAYRLGREMIWERSAHHYMESFQRARLGRQDQPSKPLAVRTLAEQQAELPDWRLDHLARMTDSTGMFQHATYTIPNFAEGYCTDDNARALLLTVLLEELGQDGPRGRRLATTYAAFLQAAFDREREAVPQLHGLRPPLAGGGRLGGLPRAGPLGAGHLRRPVAAARPASLGRRSLRAGPAGGPGDDLAPGLGVRPAGHPGIPPPVSAAIGSPARSATR